MNYYLAIDIGASSGRHILAHIENGKMRIEEIYRFKNGAQNKNGSLYWDADGLFENILAGLKKCKEINKIPASMGIDTWGVDYALLDKNDKLIDGVYCYRDLRTEPMFAKVYSRIPEAALYAKTGIAFNKFNTVYQLMHDGETGRLEKAQTFLMTPDYFHFLLTGVKVNEYTNATTTGMVDAKTKEWGKDIIEKLGFPKRLFGKLSQPGTAVGNLSQKIQKLVGFNTKVVLPGTHDTASAVFAVPAESGALYISSGTWSLLGTELDIADTREESRLSNYTNEGGCGNKYRFLKNIMGLWIIQSVKRELNDKYNFAEMEKMAKDSQAFGSVFDANAQRFLSPESMIGEIENSLAESGQRKPGTHGELFFCIYNSLAVSYAGSIAELERLTGKKYNAIHIVGGGSKDTFLSSLTAKATGRRVISGPVEATAIGNLAAQMLAAGEIKNKKQVVEIIKKSFEITEVV